ncbi:MAG: ribosome maturation factor RimM [Prevotellaceae bacterium]|nr:ribosome maturation factor RimM [Prevotellaceae bacterium]
MIRQDEVYKIGKIGKAHGVKGEVTLRFTDDVFDRVDAEYLILNVDGILVPFFMDEYRFRSDETALVKFCDIDTVERASELTGCDVFFPRSLAPVDDEEMTWSQIVGYTLIDVDDDGKEKEVGRIDDVDESTDNVLLTLDGGQLVPAAYDLIADIDHDSRKLYMNLPDGILDL